MQKKYTIIIFLGVAIACLAVAMHGWTSAPQAQTASVGSAFVSTSTQPDDFEVNEVPPPPKSVAPHQKTSAVASATPSTNTAPTNAVAPAPDVTISLSGASYPVFVPSGATVLQAMNAAASSTSLTFTGRNYPSLGFFVESIDGKQAGNGSAWIFYVNGKESQTGISSTMLHPGDTVEWRYEKSY